MTTPNASELRVDEIESTNNGAPVLFRGAIMMHAGHTGTALTVAYMETPGTITCTSLIGSGSQLTNVSTATTAIALAYNFLCI